jgi:T5orf172 domain
MSSKSFRDRMSDFGARLPPPPSHPEHKLVMEALKRRGEMDLEFRLKMGERRNEMPLFVMTRTAGGSGFTIAYTLRRYFFFEYFDRVMRHGPFSLPTSFNVVESFLSFSERFLVFDIREEREHLLRLSEYIDWYTAGSFPDKPAILNDILPEGIVYAYNMVAPLEDFAIETVDSKLRILGVAMIRHGAELSAMILAGEAPPFPSDDRVVNDFIFGKPRLGKEGLRPDPSLGVKDRYIAELPGYARVIMLARFNLNYSRYDVRYVNLDLGASYLVLTDDESIYEKDEKDAFDGSKEDLERYSGLFSALASMLYLPAFLLDQAPRIIETKFATELQVRRNTAGVRKAIKVLGITQVPFSRTVRCLASPPPDPNEIVRTVEPPNMEFESTGYWRPLAPGEIGEAKDGTPIVGKTWVERTESWSHQSLESFVVSKNKRIVVGKDPGWIYIMRSGSHYTDLYKIGLTRRSGETRSGELSSATGVPTNFEVLAQWEVGDCSAIEKEIHKRLKPLRVNKRREFFRGGLQVIVGVIDQVLRESKNSSSSGF